jgi:hypothetical protein
MLQAETTRASMDRAGETFINNLESWFSVGKIGRSPRGPPQFAEKGRGSGEKCFPAAAFRPQRLHSRARRSDLGEK